MGGALPPSDRSYRRCHYRPLADPGPVRPYEPRDCVALDVFYCGDSWARMAIGDGSNSGVSAGYRGATSPRVARSTA